LFPLDSECNWMVSRSLHPGACRVSEAILCAADPVKGSGVDPVAVVDWAFERQEALTAAANSDPESVTRMLATQFPPLAKCLGSAEVKARLNKSLRWTVQNQLQVLTPQLFVDGVKLCDEDTDLGLEYTLARMLELHDKGTLAALAPAADPNAPALVPGSEARPREEPRARTKPRAEAPRKPAPTPSPTVEDEPPPDPGPEDPGLGAVAVPSPGATPLPGVQEVLTDDDNAADDPPGEAP
jgi:hypothetical protein